MGKCVDNNSDSRGDSVSHSHVTFPLKLRKSNKSAFWLSVPECSAALNFNMSEREGGKKEGIRAKWCQVQPQLQCQRNHFAVFSKTD